MPREMKVKHFSQQVEAYYVEDRMKGWKNWNGLTPEKEKKIEEEYRIDLYRGYSDHGTWEGKRLLHAVRLYEDIPLGVLSESEISRIRELCREELLARNSPEIFTNIDECVEFCELLAKPENHIKVPSGQYVEKPVSMPTTNEMTNRAIQELTELAPHSAFAKIIDKSVGEEGVWKGKIKTCKLVDVPTEMERDYQLLRDISIQTVQHYGTKRVVIEEELRKRRERWRKGSPPKEPSGGPPSGWG